MESKNYQDELAHIRQMMERSSRFISLSGLSGVVAGIVALLGSIYVYFIFQREGVDYFDGERNIYTPALAQELFFVALVILVLAISSGYIFTAKRVKEKPESLGFYYQKTLSQLCNSISYRRIFLHCALVSSLFSFNCAVNAHFLWIRFD
jgi:hypothetical protein